MARSAGLAWGERQRRSLAALLAALLAAAGLAITPPPGDRATEVSRWPDEAAARVVVRAAAGATGAAAAAVHAVGGRVVAVLHALETVTAEVPTTRWPKLRVMPGVSSVVPSRPILLQHAEQGYDSSTDPMSLVSLLHDTGARIWHEHGLIGSGVDIAMIDSGVAPVRGLDAAGQVLHGPDLSFESQSDEHRWRDTFGHGTHMAGIIMGRDPEVDPRRVSDHHGFRGVAPGARLLSVKVADSQGVTDVSQVLAALDWVIQHRRSGGLNIRVLNLAFGTDGTQDYRLDPLTHAVEVAWRSGIVVVVAAGNDPAAGRLVNPAIDPFPIVVGAQDTKGTNSRADDVVAPFSSLGDGTRNPDVVAPGVSVAGLRAPGSHIDSEFPQARAGERHFRGSGTSQAAAMVSGAAALILQRHPQLTPDEVKAFLRTTATPIKNTSERSQGAGGINLEAAWTTPPAAGARQSWEAARGTGSLDAARGTMRLLHDGVELHGEVDIFGAAFDAAEHARAAENASAWTGGQWNGGQWTGTAWHGDRWQAAAWTRSSWSRSSWSSGGWARSSWSRSSWSGAAWGTSAWGGP